MVSPFAPPHAAPRWTGGPDRTNYNYGDIATALEVCIEAGMDVGAAAGDIM